MSPNDNRFLNDPMADPKVQAAAHIEVMNAMSAVLLEHGRANEKTFERFKKMFDDSHLKLYIIGAGVGGAVEVVRLAADVVRFAWCHYH